MTNAAVAAIQFALETDEGLNFLRLWNEGEFDILREEWPDAPEDVYIGADPLYEVLNAIKILEEAGYTIEKL